MKKIVKQFKYSFIVESNSGSFGIWQWNVFKLKWTRLGNAAGFGQLIHAEKSAKKLSDEIENMLIANQKPPIPPEDKNVMYYGRMLGEGICQKIEKNLFSLGVDFEIKRRKSGHTIIRFQKSEISKLPQDGPGPYLPLGEDHGYSFWEMTDKEWNER